MRTITIEKTLYKFEELPEKSQNKVLNRFYDLNINRDWWHSDYCDAETIGLKLTGFGLYRNRHCTGRFTESAEKVIQLIKENHGKQCETYRTALIFEQQFSEVFCQACKAGEAENCESDCEDKHKEIEEKLLKSLLEVYSIMLQEEYEYLTSREAILESIAAHEYEFTEDGHQVT